MKNILIILGVLVFSSNSFSTCEKSYEIFSITSKSNSANSNPRKEKAKKVISSGFASITGGAGIMATVYTFQNSIGAAGAPLLVTSYWMTTAGATMVAAGSISYLAALKFKKVQKALKQSRVGMGAELAEMKTDVEDLVGHEVNLLDFSKALDQENKSEVFCDPKNKLFKYDEVKNHMAKIFNK